MAYVVRSFKLTILAALMAVAHGGIFETQAVGVAPAVTRIAPIAYATTVAKAIVGPPVVAAPAVAKTVAVDTNFDPNPQYTFSYDIRDALTGDNKAQTESRNGDVVQGQYSLLEPDGTRRTVDYTSDPVNGFNAVVHHDTAAVVTKVATPVAVTSPVVTNVASPVAITAPVITKVATPVAVASPAIAAFPAAPVVKAFATPVAYATPIAKAFATPVEFATPAIGKALIH